MTLLEQTYTQLYYTALVDCAEQFSVDYLDKSKSWYAVQRHKGREFSVGAAIHCVRSLRSVQRTKALAEIQRAALSASEARLLAHLGQLHCVADVC